MRDTGERKHGLPFLAGVFTGVLIVMPILSYISRPGGDVQQQLRAIGAFPWAYGLNFTVALALAPLFIAVIISVYRQQSREAVMKGKVSSAEATALAKGKDPTSGAWMRTGYGVYAILATLSYASQIVFSILGPMELQPEKALSWYFFDPHSLPHVVNQTGYLLWGITTLFLFIPLLRRRGYVFWISMFLIIPSIIQITASITFYMGFTDLVGLTFYRGLLLLPAGILIIIYGLKTEHLN
ncbi:MAG: hypothetical protein R6V67_08210 [Spirochaetia bacterium]